MKTINFCFRVHQRFDLKRYRFFEIGNDHYYYDDYANENATTYAATNGYLKANQTLLDMIKSSNGAFKVSFAITGLAIEQFEHYAPEVIESFQALAATGCVEFMATPYGHSLAAIYNDEEFVNQVKMQADKIYRLFGKKPVTFANSALLYDDEIGLKVAKMGYKTILAEGAKHVLGWKSPHYLYAHAQNDKIKLLIRDNKLSDDINFRFSQWNWNEYPLTAEKFIGWIEQAPKEEEVFNVFMGYEALGILNNEGSGIFNFFKALPYFAMERGIGFATPSEMVQKYQPVDKFSALYPVSWTDEEKDLSAWCGNELQNEALNKLYSVAERVNLCSNRLIKSDWQRLQDTAHFFFMTTKHYSNGLIFAQQIPYDSPFEAFMNYMNVLSDFIERVEAQYPTSIDNEELNALLKTINNQENEIETLEKKIETLNKKLEKTSTPKTSVAVKTAEKSTAKKVAASTKDKKST